MSDSSQKLLAEINRLDRLSVRFSYSIRSRRLTAFLRVVSFSGSGPIWFGATFLFIILLKLNIEFIDEPVILLAAMLGAFFSLLTGQVIKGIIKRKRPFSVLENHVPLTRPPKDGSFPSTHASTAFALFVGLAIAGHCLAPFALLWSLLVGISRYYLGVHFPSDIVAGMVLGALFGLGDYTQLVNLALGL